MTIDDLKHTGWYNALPLIERLSALRVNAPQDLGAVPDLARAMRRLDRWRSEKPFVDSHRFVERLETEGVREEELRYLLGESPQAQARRHAMPPAWLEALIRAFAAPGAPDLPPTAMELSHDQAATAFLTLVAPLICAGRERLAARAAQAVRRAAAIAAGPTTLVDVCVPLLQQHVLMMLTRTMLLELNIARMQGKLGEGSAEERFRHFIASIAQPTASLELLRDYPVLARQLMLGVETWVAVCGEFIERLCADWPAICATFSPARQPGQLTGLHSTGDRHRGGRTVMIATFESGLRVVYKPRPFGLEVHFQELLAWLNAHGVEPPLYVATCLNRHAYGWMQFIAAQDCHSHAEMERFYQRQGAYLALLYVLEATDAHFENIIAMGEHPMYIDLESLFHPHFMGLDQTASSRAGDALMSTVLRVGLLPRRSWTNAGSSGVDTSGLGSTPGQVSPREAQYIAGLGTDEMRIDRQYTSMPSGVNRPRLNGDYVDLLGYQEVLIESFSRMYRLLMEYHEALLAPDGPIARFAEDEIRVLLRPTHLYNLMLRESYHPDLLRDALDRDRFFDRLWGRLEAFPYVKDVITAERADLWRDDIPLFSARPWSSDLWTSTGAHIHDFFARSGMELVQQRLRQLSQTDLDLQRWCIRASFATLAIGKAEAQMPTYQAIEPARLAAPTDYLAAACAVGDRLAELAFRDQDSAAWFGIAAVREHYWDLAALGCDLHSGLPGVALFLAYLGHVSGESRYTQLARAAMTGARNLIDQQPVQEQSIGGFGQLGGMIYALCHIGKLWGDPALLTYAAQLAEGVAARIERDRFLDVMSGAAGCIGSLLCLHRCRPQDRWLEIAAQCAQHLVAQARTTQPGMAWVTPIAPVPLTGFSHGAAGFAWALLELAGARGEAHWSDVAQAALAYERAHFDPTARNWLDLRYPLDQKASMVAWCHGAVGIGLARLAMLRHLDTPTVRDEIAAALDTTLAHGFGRNHSLCHGDWGNLQLLLHAQHICPEMNLADHIQRIATTILASVKRDGWLCGVPLGVETPGLMDGIAGIGYGMLRMAAPQDVPLVLVLEAPRGT